MSKALRNASVGINDIAVPIEKVRKKVIELNKNDSPIPDFFESLSNLDTHN